MAKTLIGQLVLRLRTEGLSEANKVERAMRNVEAAARKLASAPAPTWGIGFQRQLDKLKLTNQQIAGVQRSWAAMHDSMRTKGLSSALRVGETANWKNATVMHFAAVRDEHSNAMKAMEDRARTHGRIMRGFARSMLVAAGAYTGVYGAGMVGRQGVIASATEERERFRADMAGIPENEQERLFDESLRLSAKYRAASFPEIAEMARNARATMGTTDRAIEILETLTQGLVTLKSTKGPDAAAHELSRLVRGIDNLGKNAEGDIGIEDTKALIEGLVRASQIEGRELDVGTLFDFARRAKVAGPALDTEFLANVAPAIMQDMTAHGAGTALAMAFKSFILGDRSIAGKRYMAAQSDMGLRSGLTLNSRGNIENTGEIVDADLMGRNPYDWVKTYLIPALEKRGVDTNDDNAIAQAVGKLSGNTNATGLLTRMVQQREQIDRLLGAYSNTMGLDAAEKASTRDPFVAWEGFKSSLENLSGAMGGMPAITSGLNTLADLVNNLQQRIRDGDPLVSNAATVAGVGAAGGSAYLLVRGVHGLITAGTNLNAAAANLNVAAARLGGSAAVDAVSNNSKSPKGIPIVGPLMAAYGLYEIAKGFKGASEGIEIRKPEPNTPGDYFNRIRDRNLNPKDDEDQGPGFWKRFFLGDAADPEFSFRGAMQVDAGISGNREATDEAQTLRGDLDALNVTATPQVDTSSIRAARQDAEALLATLHRVGSLVSDAAADVGAELRRNYAD